MNSCKHCIAVHQEMQPIWKGLIVFYRGRLAALRSDPNYRSDRKVRRQVRKTIGLINRFVEKLRSPVPTTCTWKKEVLQ